MTAFAILRQSHTPQSAFDTVRDALVRAHQWSRHGDGEIPEWEALSSGADQRANFRRAATFLRRRLDDGVSLTVLVDEVDTVRMNPLRSGDWSALLAMLILGFPEVRWVFLVVKGRADEARHAAIELGDELSSVQREGQLWYLVSGLHGAQTLGDKRGSPLFDGYGLRGAVLERMALDSLTDPRKNGGEPGAIPRRKDIAVVLDDETGFNQFEALMAYGRGFRVNAVASWTEARALLGPRGWLVADEPSDAREETVPIRHLPSREERVRASESANLRLTIEDLFLSFPDQGGSHLSRLDWRSQQLPGLSLAKSKRLHRRFVTVDHERAGRDARERRGESLEDLREEESKAGGFRLRKRNQVVRKPAADLYTLWSELGMVRALRRPGEKRIYRGLATCFCWPPPPEPDEEGDTACGHSSPGRLVEIAESLLERASARTKDVSSVIEIVRGAMLATQALELLGGRTPTLSLEALSLKHRFEVSAECHFVGVEYHSALGQRLKDIERNLEAMSQWLNRRRRQDFVLHGAAKIVTQLIAILDAHGNFEEAEEGRDHLRRLHHQISYRNARRRGNVIRVLLRPFTLYMDWVLRSPAHFVAAIFAAITVFTLLFALTERHTLVADALYATIRAMLAEVPSWDELKSSQESSLLIAINGLAAAFGLLNFGLFVSRLYSRIVRK